MTPYFHDDGTEINPDLIPMPDLCLVCRKKNIPEEEIPCTLNRIGLKAGEEFECFAFETIYE